MGEWHTEPLIHLQKDIVSTWVEELLQTSQKPYSTKAWRLQQLAYDVSFLHKKAVKVAVDRLVESLNHMYITKRISALQALGKLGKWVPLEPLLEALHDEDSIVCRAAAEALGELGERVPLEPLLAALEDVDW